MLPPSVIFPARDHPETSLRDRLAASARLLNYPTLAGCGYQPTGALIPAPAAAGGQFKIRYRQRCTHCHESDPLTHHPST